MTMTSNAERKAALAELSRIERDKKAVSERLKQERKEALARGDRATADRITRQRIQLGHQHVRLMNAKRRVNSSGNIAQATARLKGLADKADRAVRNLNSLAKALDAVADIIRILKALTGAFV